MTRSALCAQPDLALYWHRGGTFLLILACVCMWGRTIFTTVKTFSPRLCLGGLDGNLEEQGPVVCGLSGRGVSQLPFGCLIVTLATSLEAF